MRLVAAAAAAMEVVDSVVTASAGARAAAKAEVRWEAKGSEEAAKAMTGKAAAVLAEA